jgi:hypothetical protein
VPPDVVNELLISPFPEHKLGRRDISKREALQILSGTNALMKNHRSPDGRRKLLVGETHGGRVLTLVVERTHDPTTWIVVTGWNAAPDERSTIKK